MPGREPLHRDGYDTIPKLLVRNAQRFGHRKTAIREKEYGIWQSYSWADYLNQVRDFALGLVSLGFQRGDKLAVIGDNRPQLYWAMVAAQAVGGIPVPIYQDSIAREVQYVVDHSESVIVVAEDQEQVDKLLEVREDLPRVRYIIYDDPRGMREYQARFSDLLAFTQVQEMGRRLAQEQAHLFEEEVAKGQAGDIAIINYTSGTTGNPKGVMLTHQNLIQNALSLLQVDPLTEKDEVMAYLPMAWIGDTFFSVVLAMLTGCAVNCPEEASTVQKDFREIGPTMTFAPPRIWENMLTQVQVRIEDSDWLKRRIAHFFISLAMRSEERRIKRQSVPLLWRLLYPLGEFLVYGALRDHLGLRRIRVATTGGAAIGPEVFLFFRGIGVNLKQIYGLTESSAPVTLHRNGDVKVDTVGPALPGWEVKIAENGEVLLRGPGVFKGYYKNPEATASTLDGEGWLHTGDAGYLDPDGHLAIVDRAKDVARMADGTIFAPQFIENKLKFSQYIREAVAIGQDRPYVVAMINIDMSTVGNWAEKRGIPYAGYPDLSQKPEVYDLIHREVVRVNQSLPEAVRIRRFCILHKELDPDDEEITRTRKVRRRIIAQKYADIINALYSGASEVRVKATITYEDGRKGEVERVVRIREVEPVTAPSGSRS